MKLLTVSNPKTAKGEARGHLTGILHLAPAKLSGRNVCPMATAGCTAACLNTAGLGGVYQSIQDARVRKTRLYFDDRPGFMRQLVLDIEALCRKAERDGLIPCVRLNGTSDIRWETVGCERLMPWGMVPWANVFYAFSSVQFYDYTKLPNRRNLPPNYHLTFSLAEGEKNWDDHLQALENGYNVAVVLRGAGTSTHKRPFPLTWNGRPLVDGDESDLRFLDRPSSGAYIGLRAKGKAIKDESGFVRDAFKDDLDMEIQNGWV